MDDRTLKIYADIFDAEQIHAARAEDVVMRNYEIDVAAMVFDPTVWTGAALNTTIQNEWDDPDNATPIKDVKGAVEKVELNSGLTPNAVIMNRTVFRNLRETIDIIDRIKYSGIDDPKKITPMMLAALFDVQYVLVAGGHKNTANEAQAASISRIWSNEYVMVCRVAETDDPREPCIGRTFVWSEDGPGSLGTEEEIAVLVEEYREEGVRGSVLRARTDRDEVVMYVEAGHLLDNATT